MKSLNRVILAFSLFVIASCGGGGGGGGGGGDGYGSSSGNMNGAPNITNSSFDISVQENQTSAFTVTASDPDGDALTFSISGTDASLLSITSNGVVTFNAAPDYEAPSDANGDNLYEISATVSDGSLTDSENFRITVTNDTSDDVTTVGYDGTILAMGPIQGASVCIEVNSGTCDGAQYTATSAQDGTFSITVDSGTSGVIRSEGGFDPVTNLQLMDSDSLALSQPVTDQNFVVTPLSTMLNEYNSTDYETLKSKLGINANFMIRFDNPFSDVNSAVNNKVAVVNTQALVLYKVLEAVNPNPTSNSMIYKFTESVLNRSGSETSLGDTTFIKDLFTNLDSGFSPSSQQLVDLSAGTSAYLQKIYADSSNSLSHFAKAGVTELATLMRAVVDGTSTTEEIDKLTFNTIDWIDENTSWDGGAITDNESYLNETTYSLSNNGSSNYLVDGINTSSTELIIYVKEGDVVKFNATGSVTSGHPFKMSTVQNATSSDSGEIGSNEGWDANSLTLTVGANTPDTIYPYCDYHSGMYSSGKIVKVTSFNQSSIDVSNSSGALQVKGTIATGPFKGASGFTHAVYLNSQDSATHPHTFYEYPGLTFYMPDTGGYHGAENESSETLFKPKSHYNESGSDGGGY